MFKKTLPLIALAALIWALPAAAGQTKKGKAACKSREEITQQGAIELWRAPNDIGRRDLFYGPGGKDHAPHSSYKFLKEDMNGTNPKLHVRDENDIKWRVKLGAEARPEPAASRLLWAVGYLTNEFYFLPDLTVQGLPAHLRRGQNLVGTGGAMRNVDMKRLEKNEKKIGIWRWRHNPFFGSREFNGLRVMMALINNWDLKDDNNEIYEVVNAGKREYIYRVSDLGASFGSSGPSWTSEMAKGNVRSYEHSKFIRRVTPDYVDFDFPTRPALKYIFNPPALISHLRQRWIGRHIPRNDVRWVGNLLAQLSPDQIRDAFRAGGFSSKDVEAYTQIVEGRIRELNGL